MPKPIKIHTQAPNSYGIVVLTGGIDWSRFDANPVMLDSHNDTLILGRWTGRKVDGSEVEATPEFNSENDHAASKEQEYEGGFLNGASLGLDFDFDDIQINPALGFGDTPVLVKCECYEASLCAIPSNPQALKMKAGGEKLTPEQFKKKLTLKLSAYNESQNNLHIMADLKLLKKALKLDSAHDDNDTLGEALNKIKEGEAAVKELAALKLSIQADKETEITEMIDAAVAEGKIEAADKTEYVEMAKLNLKATKKLLGLTKAAPAQTQNPVKKILAGGAGGGGNAGNIELSKATYDKMHRDGTLLALKKNDPETYEALLKAKKDEVIASGVVRTK